MQQFNINLICQITDLRGQENLQCTYKKQIRVFYMLCCRTLTKVIQVLLSKIKRSIFIKLLKID